MNLVKPRHELKYIINLTDYYMIKSRIKHVAKPDIHANKDGTYTVHSLYFDNFDDQVLKEKYDGLNKRDKYRIRYYNQSSNFIRIERKSKVNNLSYKVSTEISYEECIKIINGEIEFLKNSSNQLLKDFYNDLKHLFLKPKSIVHYRREAYLFSPGNVRITFDSDIRTSYNFKNFLGNDYTHTTLNQMVLEVKYDEFLPDLITNLIQTNERMITSISKYANSRIYR